jgi:hypothetical protein
MTIRVLYSCAGCGLKDVAMDVPVRVEGEEIVPWMQSTVMLLSADHRRRRPSCTAIAMQEVKIPITHADRVGGPSIQ